MNLTLSIGPLVSLIAGILILIVPRLLNYIVAIYLIIIGLLGLFVIRHAQNVVGVVAEIDALPVCLRMGADDRLIDWRLLTLLLFGHEIDPMPARARKIEIVHRAQVRDARLPRRAQPVISAVH